MHAIKNKLVEVARSASGWAVLYKDEASGIYWELTYQNENEFGDIHLKTMCSNEVAGKYQNCIC